MSDSEQLAVKEPRSVKDYLALPAYKDRFTEVLNKRAPQFMAAITAVSQMPSLRDAEPRSVIAAAMVSATLDLPVNPTLGQSHIVAYRDQSGQSIAQFQIGYRGLIQLALRSGQYRRMNAQAVNAEVFAGYDMVGEPKLDWTKYDPTKEIGGYFCAFELVNGFTKVVYWSRAQVEAHAKRFSKAYQKGFKSSPWFTDFDSMATKTVIKNALTKWGMLSVEMQKAVVHDQGAQADVDAEVKFVDGSDSTVESESMPGDPIPDRPAPKPRAAKGAAAVRQNAPEVVVEAPPTETVARVPEPPKTVTEAKPEPRNVTPKAEAISAENAKTAESLTQMAAAKPVQRALLHPDETITVEAMVDQFKVVTGVRAGQPWPYVTADIVSPELRGQVDMTDGAVKDGHAIPEWQLDKPVRLALLGKKYKTGAIRNVVTKIEVLEAAGDTPQGEDV